MAGERTEQASPRRRQKAREQGDRPRSRDLAAAAATLAGTLALSGIAPRLLEGWRAAYEHSLLLGQGATWRGEEAIAAMLDLRSIVIAAMLPLCAVLLAGAGAAMMAGVAQGGGVSVHAETLQPKWTRIDPISNGKNLFSLRTLSRLAKTLVPVAALAALAWRQLMRQTELPVFSLARMPAAMISAYDLLVDAAWILFLWSAIDYAVEWRSWTERLKMSKQELREEFKETEGNPQVRGRIRNLRRQLRARTLRADVARASVVIANPIHYAVALSFDFATMDTPRLLAKGRNLLAEQIKTEARWAGVPIVENPPLARSLYRSVEAGQAIPFELYAAVAGILAYLYRQQVEERLRKQTAARTGGDAAAGAGRPAVPNVPGVGGPSPVTRSASEQPDNARPATPQAKNAEPKNAEPKSAEPGNAELGNVEHADARPANASPLNAEAQDVGTQILTENP